MLIINAANTLDAPQPLALAFNRVVSISPVKGEDNKKAAREDIARLLREPTKDQTKISWINTTFQGTENLFSTYVDGDFDTLVARFAEAGRMNSLLDLREISQSTPFAPGAKTRGIDGP